MNFKRAALLPILVLVTLLMANICAMAASKPEISHQTSQYIDRAISINLQWQSPNPVTRVLVYAGSGEKEIKVDEYDNRRNPYGYEGEVTVVVPVDPNLYQGTVPYQIQLEDDLRLKSDLFSGTVKLPIAAAPGMPGMMSGMPGMMPMTPGGQAAPSGDDGWGKSNIRAGKGTGQGASGQSNDMVDKLLKVAERFDTPPTLESIKVNVLGPDNVSFSSRANDDKGIREIAFRVYDNQGNKIGEQLLSNLGRKWEGSSQPVKTGGGSFIVVAQAVDSTGNTSKEQRASFSMSGAPLQPQPVQTPATVTTAQPVDTQPVVQTPATQTPVEQTPVVTPTVEQPPVVTPSVVTPPVVTPPVVTPPVEIPPVVIPPVVIPPVVTPPVVTPPVEIPPVVIPPVVTPPVIKPPITVIPVPLTPANGALQQNMPSVPEPVIYSNGNIAGVQNGPTKATTFSIDAPHRLTFIYTYHYFNGNTPPGTISLRHSDGTVYGPWSAQGALGQGGVRNAYWFALPNVEIKAGSYTVIDSNQATWSHNSGSGGAGFTELRGTKLAPTIKLPFTRPPLTVSQQNLPSVSDPVIFSNGNIAAVQNGPTKSTTFSIDAPHKLTFIYTYHYFNNSTPPGTISLKHADGTTYGPWTAQGALGQGGVLNAYWFALPNVEIKAGSYMVVDSNQATWSHNTGSSGAGFAELKGIKLAVTSPAFGITGTWNTSEGMMVLTQSGNNVNGTYNQDNGRISGLISGSNLDGIWIENSSAQRCAVPVNGNNYYWGKIVFTFNTNHFDGKWSYCNDTPTRPWTGDKK